MTVEEFIDYIEEKTYPFTFRETGRAKLSELYRKYPEDLLLECVDIGVAKYFRYDGDGNLIQDSVGRFLDKLGGIAYNKSLNPIDQKIKQIEIICNNNFYYWDNTRGHEILTRYVLALRNNGLSDDNILEDLENEVLRVTRVCRNWTEWTNILEDWISDIKESGAEIKTYYRIFTAPIDEWRNEDKYNYIAEFSDPIMAKEFMKIFRLNEKYEQSAIIVIECQKKRRSPAGGERIIVINYKGNYLEASGKEI